MQYDSSIFRVASATPNSIKPPPFSMIDSQLDRRVPLPISYYEDVSDGQYNQRRSSSSSFVRTYVVKTGQTANSSANASSLGYRLLNSLGDPGCSQYIYQQRDSFVCNYKKRRHVQSTASCRNVVKVETRTYGAKKLLHLPPAYHQQGITLIKKG